MSQPSAPSVWAVTLGFNHVDDSLECIESLLKTPNCNLSVLFTDNASSDGSPDKVRAAFPSVHVLETGSNLGFARGFNEGFKYALAHGADYVFLVNNDTVVDPLCIPSLLAEAVAHPEAGIVVPKIYYHADPTAVWSAGSRFRPFPPAVVMRKTRGPDDGRYDSSPVVQYTTTCALLVSRRFLEEVGLLDGDFFIMYDDYDWSVRAADAGFSIRFVPAAKLWHKVSKSTGVGTPNPFFWRHYGRSTALFFRKHRNHPWLTSPVHLLYILARILLEGTAYGFRPFLQGYREGRRLPLTPPPKP